MARKPDIIAVLPAAGKARRLGPLPCSKEVLPLVPDRPGSYLPAPGTRTVIEDALHMLGENGIESAIIVTAPGKDDIQESLGTGPVGGVDLRYLVREDSPSVPHTLQTALTLSDDNDVLLWFPDIIVEPRTLISTSIERHRTSAADLTLALVPSSRGEKVDIVSIDSSDEVTRIHPKPGKGVSGWTWVAALWSARFSGFLDEYVASCAGGEREMFVGDVINAARVNGFIVHSVNFPRGAATDIGTPDDLARLWAESSDT